MKEAIVAGLLGVRMSVITKFGLRSMSEGQSTRTEKRTGRLFLSQLEGLPSGDLEDEMGIVILPTLCVYVVSG